MASETRAMERVCRMGCSRRLDRDEVARRFCGEVVDMMSVVVANKGSGMVYQINAGIRV